MYLAATPRRNTATQRGGCATSRGRHTVAVSQALSMDRLHVRDVFICLIFLIVRTENMFHPCVVVYEYTKNLLLLLQARGQAVRRRLRHPLSNRPDPTVCPIYRYTTDPFCAAQKNHNPTSVKKGVKKKGKTKRGYQNQEHNPHTPFTRPIYIHIHRVPSIFPFRLPG